MDFFCVLTLHALGMALVRTEDIAEALGSVGWRGCTQLGVALAEKDGFDNEGSEGLGTVVAAPNVKKSVKTKTKYILPDYQK